MNEEEEEPKKIDVRQYSIKVPSIEVPSDEESEEELEKLKEKKDEIINNIRKKRRLCL